MIAVLLICIILWLFASSFLVREFANFGAGFDSAMYSLLPEGFKYSQNLEAENKSQKAQIALLASSNADRNILANENERLKSLLGRNEKEKIVYATILKRPPDSPYDTLILDAGTGDGVKVGNNVISGNVLVGSIIESGSGYSKAKLFSSPGNIFSGMLSDHIQIEAKGLGGGSFEVVAPIGASVSVGDALVLPAISSKIFGLVQNIEEKPTEGFKRILFSLPINPNQIDAVGIALE